MSRFPRARSFLANHGFHLPLLLLGIAVAIALGRSNIVAQVAQAGVGGMILAILVFGAMYSSVLTVTPAMVGLVALAQTGIPIPLLAIVGGIGATITDISLFQVIRSDFTDQLLAFIRRHSEGQLKRLFRQPFVRLLIAIAGAVTIATPIPDEIGLAMMGLGRVRWTFVAVVGLIFNTLGIAVIGLLSQ